mgnify:CR=1 FL=1
MKRAITLIAALALGTAAFAQEAESPPPPSPKEVLEAAPADAWQEIAPVDLLVFQLAPAPDGSERRIVIQLMDAPWSQKWVRNMRQLAQGGWWDTNSSVYRIAPGFVAQWGDPNEDRAPMEGLEEVGRADFIHPLSEPVSLPNPCEDRVFDNAFIGLEATRARATTSIDLPPNVIADLDETARELGLEPLRTTA